MTKIDDRFSSRAKSVLTQAEVEVKRFGHEEVEPADILLVLIGERDGVGAKALITLGFGSQRIYLKARGRGRTE